MNLYAASLCHLGYLRLAKQLLDYLLGIDPFSLTRGNRSTSEANLRHHKEPPEKHLDAVRSGLIEGRSRPRPSLAVCMIVKDEAEFIEGAVKSVEDIADEIIVVDTGSTDSTVSLARAAGARVEFFKWTGDFSEARNVSVEYATSDWILILDADERLTSASKTSLRAVLEEYHGDEERRVICVRLTTTPAVGSS